MRVKTTTLFVTFNTTVLLR